MEDGLCLSFLRSSAKQNGRPVCRVAGERLPERKQRNSFPDVRRGTRQARTLWAYKRVVRNTMGPHQSRMGEKVEERLHAGQRLLLRQCSVAGYKRCGDP